MTLTHEINMDLIRKGDTPRISAVQGDRSSRRIDIGLLSGGTAWEPPEDAQVLIRYRRPDGTDGVYDTLPDGEAAAQLSGSHISFTIVPDALSQPGAVRLAVTLIHQEQELTTFTILILVQPTYGAQVTEQGDYISVAGLLPAPEGASSGQYLVVDEVDSSGRVLSVKGAEKAGEDNAGKSAYAYALEGGYEGTEAEFAAKLAEESLTLCCLTLGEGEDGGYVFDKTFAQAKQAYDEGRMLYCVIPAQIAEVETVVLGLQTFLDADGYQCFMFGGGTYGYGHYAGIDSDGQVFYGYDQRPETLPNPNRLSLRIGSSSVTYDGSAAKTLNVTALKNPNALTIDGAEYDGSEAVSVTTPKAFYVTVTDNGDQTGTMDKTYDEVAEAYKAGCPVIAMLIADDGVSFHGGVLLTGDAEMLFGAVISQIDTSNAVFVGLTSDMVMLSVTAIASVTSVNGQTGAVTLEIPTVPAALPSPGRLIFTGAVSAEYDGSAEVTVTIPAGESETVTVLSDNLFDKGTAVSGQVFYPGSSGPSLVDESTGFYAYVELRGAGTYRLKVSRALHGDYAFRIPLLTSDKTFLRNAAATLVDSSDTSDEPVAEFTVTAEDISGGAAYLAYDGALVYLDSLMIVKDRDYPDEYISYGYIEVATDGSKKQDNILYGKTAVFLGDSICAGTTTLADAAEYGYGWAGLIGEANAMTWGNYGRNGGTVTPIESVDEDRWLGTQADTALAAHAAADYVIFEGGCNDADTLGEDGLGELSSGGYAPSGESDFTGAFETLVLKLLNGFPGAKIGYIVAQKMGTSGDYGSENNRYRQFFDRAVEICEKWGIPVLDLWKGNPLNPMLSAHYDSSLTADEANEAGLFYTDGQHLTLAGYQRITPQIEAWMRTL